MMRTPNTQQDAEKALTSLEEIFNRYSVFNDGPINMSFVEPRDGEYGITVGIERDLTEDEKKVLPKEHLGVNVKYEVTGPNVAF